MRNVKSRTMERQTHTRRYRKKKLKMEMKRANKRNSYNQIALTTESTGGDGSQRTHNRSNATTIFSEVTKRIINQTVNWILDKVYSIQYTYDWRQFDSAPSFMATVPLLHFIPTAFRFTSFIPFFLLFFFYFVVLFPSPSAPVVRSFSFVWKISAFRVNPVEA